MVDADVLSDLVADVLCRRLATPTSAVIGALRRSAAGKGRKAIGCGARRDRIRGWTASGRAARPS